MRNASAPSSSGSIQRKVGPPSLAGASSTTGTTTRSVRRTARERTEVVPDLLESDVDGYPATHPYIRRFWIPLLGPGAVADLCRLAAAAQRGRPLKIPVHLEALARRGLVARRPDGTIAVARVIRPLNPLEVRRLPPSLRTAHRHHETRRRRHT